MNISLAWLNSLLAPGDVSADEAERVLTFVGFPIESKTAQPSGDTLLDVEVTSNRGDCLSHEGVAREVAAATGRKLNLPAPLIAPASAPAPLQSGTITGLTLDNRVPDQCPLFVVRVIRAVKVGPSPAWLVQRLEAVGLRSVSNVVDITNFAQLELGNPSHAFDLANVRGGSLIVRAAEKGEKLTLLDGKATDLRPGELVVADASGPTSLAGVMGGKDSGVSASTRDVVLEVATWAPGMVRAAARRLGIRTDASHRFERTVDPRTIERASMRIAELIVQVAGGTIEPQVLRAGKPVPVAPAIDFRPRRCRLVLGAGFDDAQIRAALAAQAVQIGTGSADSWPCVPPDHRPDIKREIDLIEEVARTIGLDKIPAHDRILVHTAPPQKSELAVREVARLLTGLGFDETITVSFVSAAQARPFAVAGISALRVSDERRRDDGVLRPSVIASLLGCRRVNQSAKSAPAGAVRLFEVASVYGQQEGPAPGQDHFERRTIAMIVDAPTGQAVGSKAFDQRQAAIRTMRGIIETLVNAMRPRAERLTVHAEGGQSAAFVGAYEAGESASLSLAGKPLGTMGLISKAVMSQYELAHPVAAAEIDLAMLVDGYPPKRLVTALPQFPATDRDLSLVVSEKTAYSMIEEVVHTAKPAQMEALALAGVYRGKPLDDGTKSVTLRFTFRHAERTLRDDEVNSEMDRVIALAKDKIGAVVRV